MGHTVTSWVHLYIGWADEWVDYSHSQYLSITPTLILHFFYFISLPYTWYVLFLWTVLHCSMVHYAYTNVHITLNITLLVLLWKSAHILYKLNFFLHFYLFVFTTPKIKKVSQTFLNIPQLLFIWTWALIPTMLSIMLTFVKF